jgi:hypothetical protein
MNANLAPTPAGVAPQLQAAIQRDAGILEAAKRMADVMNMHAVLKQRGWAAFALADGRSDNVPYETRDDAVRHHKWDRDNYLYLEIPRGGVNDPLEMAGCLHYARTLHKMGYRLPDPRDFHSSDRDFPVHQPPVLSGDWSRQIRNLTKKR